VRSLLLVVTCILQVGDEYWNETRLFFNRGTKLFANLTRKTHTTAYGVEYQQKLRQQQKPSAPPPAKVSKVKDAPPPTKRSKAATTPFSVDTICAENIMLPAADGIVTRKRMGGASTRQVEDSSPPAITLPAGFPRALSPRPYGPNALKFRDQEMSSELAMFMCCIETCAVCGSPGNVNYMLFCVDCGECFHGYCVDAPWSAMCKSARNLTEKEIASPLDRWRCANCCAYCARCQKKSRSDAPVLHCKLCENAYHWKCVSLSMSISVDDWVCGDCVGLVPCRSCTELELDADNKLHVERLVGRVFFQDKKMPWGSDSACLKCLCMQKYMAHEDLHSFICISTSCTVCKQDCSDRVVTEEGEVSARQCLSCFRFTHTACRRDTDTRSDIDLESVCGEYMCETCWVANDSRYDDVETMLHVRSVKRNQLERMHRVAGDVSLVGGDWPHSSSMRALSAIVSWAAHCCQQLCCFKHDGGAVSDMLLSQQLGYSRHVSRARTFLRMWKSHIHTSPDVVEDRQMCLLSGGLHVTANTRRSPGSLVRLAHLASSFLYVAMIERSQQRLSIFKEWDPCGITSPPPEAVALVGPCESGSSLVIVSVVRCIPFVYNMQLTIFEGGHPSNHYFRGPNCELDISLERMSKR
jgi:hypothetical protein